jgi:hypothetical protein
MNLAYRADIVGRNAFKSCALAKLSLSRAYIPESDFVRSLVIFVGAKASTK